MNDEDWVKNAKLLRLKGQTKRPSKAWKEVLDKHARHRIKARWWNGS